VSSTFLSHWNFFQLTTEHNVARTLGVCGVETRLDAFPVGQPLFEAQSSAGSFEFVLGFERIGSATGARPVWHRHSCLF
jgi:hypothetical protein